MSVFRSAGPRVKPTICGGPAAGSAKRCLCQPARCRRHNRSPPARSALPAANASRPGKAPRRPGRNAHTILGLLLRITHRNYRPALHLFGRRHFMSDCTSPNPIASRMDASPAVPRRRRARRAWRWPSPPRWATGTMAALWRRMDALFGADALRRRRCRAGDPRPVGLPPPRSGARSRAGPTLIAGRRRAGLGHRRPQVAEVARLALRRRGGRRAGPHPTVAVRRRRLLPCHVGADRPRPVADAPRQRKFRDALQSQRARLNVLADEAPWAGRDGRRPVGRRPARDRPAAGRRLPAGQHGGRDIDSRPGGVCLLGHATVIDRLNIVSEAFGRMAAGNLKTHLVCRSQDEIGVLARQFNELASALEGRHRLNRPARLLRPNRSRPPGSRRRPPLPPRTAPPARAACWSPKTARRTAASCRLCSRKAGAEVTLAENGDEAMHKAVAAGQAGREFDLILMDMEMPILDGYRATRPPARRGLCRPNHRRHRPLRKLRRAKMPRRRLRPVLFRQTGQSARPSSVWWPARRALPAAAPRGG